MTRLTLPALDGRTPLGFLAALGVLRLITEHGHPQTRLAWSPRNCTAQLHDAHTSLSDLATDLQAIVESIPEHGVLPDMPTDFPPLGAAPDKLRLTRPELRLYAAALREQVDPTARTLTEQWLCSLVTDLSLDDQQRADIGLFTAPAGKQSMRTMLEKPLAAVRKNPQTLLEALHSWRRYSGVTGEYLDNRAVFDAGEAPDGKPAMRGVPGATWLALMSYPLLLSTSVAGEPVTSGWQRIRTRRAVNRLIYPLWTTPLDPQGALALLTHPILRGAAPGKPPEAARAASIFLIAVAERRSAEGQKSAGVLMPIPPPQPTPRPPIHRPLAHPGESAAHRSTHSPTIL